MCLKLKFFSRLESGIFWGSNNAQATPRLVSFRGLIQNFRQVFPPFLNGSSSRGLQVGMKQNKKRELRESSFFLFFLQLTLSLIQ